MTDKIFTYVFRILGQETALLLTRYKSDNQVIDNLYEDMLLDVADAESAGFVNYLTKLISFLEVKEDYEKCASLLKLKNKIKNYKDE